jgi:osmotically-inducible protein OsmY
MGRRDEREDRSRRYGDRDRHDRDRYDRDDEAGPRGQYGDLRHGLGYGGGRDLENIDRFGRGRDPDRYPRGGRYTEEGWREEAPGHGSGDREGPRGWSDRASDEVASWFGDEGARRRREADHRGKGPRGYRRSDDRIRDEVCDRLTDDRDVDATDITVSVREGEVTLDGNVGTRREKRLAEDCVEDVSGVLHVQNNLRVRPADRDDITPSPQGAGTV